MGNYSICLTGIHDFWAMCSWQWQVPRRQVCGNPSHPSPPHTTPSRSPENVSEWCALSAVFPHQLDFSPPLIFLRFLNLRSLNWRKLWATRKARQTFVWRPSQWNFTHRFPELFPSRSSKTVHRKQRRTSTEKHLNHTWSLLLVLTQIVQASTGLELLQWIFVTIVLSYLVIEVSFVFFFRVPQIVWVTQKCYNGRIANQNLLRKVAESCQSVFKVTWALLNSLMSESTVLSSSQRLDTLGLWTAWSLKPNQVPSNPWNTKIAPK